MYSQSCSSEFPFRRQGVCQVVGDEGTGSLPGCCCDDNVQGSLGTKPWK